MKKLITAILLASTLILAGASAPQFIPNKTYSQQTWALSRLSVYQLQGSEGQGSAVILDSNYAITAGHAVFGQDTVTLISPDKVPQIVKVLKYDGERDLALLEGRFNQSGVVLSRKTPELDAVLVAIGYPLGGQLNSIQVATYGHYQGVLDDVFFLHTVPTMFGNSGGGIFNTAGELVGVTVGVANGGGFPAVNLGVAVRWDMIHKFIHETNQ